MISKLAGMRDSWFTKIILTVTALSFMSLFGVSSYINSANNNKSVIKVGDIEISQSEFNFLVQKEMTKLRAMGFDDTDENNEKKNEIINALVKSKVDEAIMQNLMNKYNVDFTDSLIRSIILQNPNFLNANGQFDHEAYKWYLNRSNQSELDYVKQIKLDVAKKVMIDSQVAYANIPQVLQKQMEKVLGQRRTFKYIKVSPSDVQITRQPTKEELDQYYEDMSEEFTVPESRNISLMFIPQDKIEAGIEVSQEEIDAYYKEHIEEYEQPAKRKVLQLVFENKEDAEKALERLDAGEDFMKVAEDNGQKAEDVDLDFVAAGDLSEELSELVFSLPQGQVSAVTPIADTWQIIKVTDLKAPVTVNRQQADAEIKTEIQQEKAYDGSYEIIAAIEDKLAAETSLEDLAASYGVAIQKAQQVLENGEAAVADQNIRPLLSNADVIDSAFSYNEGEVSQVVEDDNGLVVVRIDEIIPSHVQPRKEAEAKLKILWRENEIAAIVQEKIDNIEHDLEMGDSLKDISGRYNLNLISTMPLNRGESFADLSYESMRELFALSVDEPKIVRSGDDYIVAETSKIIDDRASLSEEDKNFLMQALYAEQSREMSDALLHGFAKDNKIEINYHRMGLSD